MRPDPQPALAPADVQATFAATLVDEWVRDGLTDAVVCPGSRSTPLALALAEHQGVRVHVHHDERSGAFLAVGIGLATGRPALVLTTSGTAAAELHPAVVEADLAAVSLLVCTADRPPELRDVGAPQAIDQVHLYGRSVRWYGDPGVPEAAGTGRWRAFAARAYATTLGARPGPVHLNLPFREPLVGTAGPLPPARGDGSWTSVASVARSLPPARGDGTWVAEVGRGARAALPPAAARVVDDLVGRRGVFVAGAADVDGVALHEVALAIGWPVIAEPRSPAWIAAPPLVRHADAIMRSTRAADLLRPEVIVRLGAPGSSRVVNEWLAGSGGREVVVGTVAGWSDPSASAAIVVEGDPAIESVSDPPMPGEPARPLATPVTEPTIARAVVRALPDGAHLVVSSSMPIRDVERYAVPRPGRPRRSVIVHANRGANGIDGVVSAAVGVAAGSRAPTALLIGDVALVHDSNGLLGASGRGIDLVCVVVDNDGGGIFSFLPQARVVADDRFETLFGTPHGLDLVALASAYGVDARRLDPDDDVAAAVAEACDKGGVRVLVIATDRRANVEVHRRIDEAAAAAVDDALAPHP
jgi:2-succinyl-5-enolpyruvyl-6-hydroxy-3-cyclohexene-1-carboxylate synthase